jgi:translocation and assembly module TamA
LNIGRIIVWRLRFRLYLLSVAALWLIGGGAAGAQNSKPTAEPILTDKEFDAAFDGLDLAPAEPLQTITEWEKQQNEEEMLVPEPAIDPQIDEPLKPVETFDAEPPVEPTDREDDSETQKIHYTWRIEGLDEDQDALADVLTQFKKLSALEDGDGKADNGAMVAARLAEDQQLAISLFSSQGYFDATVNGHIDQPAKEGDPASVVLSVIPGPRYALGSIVFDAARVEPATLITDNFVPKVGEPIVAERILSAEANIALVLPQQGYPFAKVGQRDILLDPAKQTGDYTLPVDTGQRSVFGKIVTNGGGVFAADHIELLRRFQKGELYDSRKLDDLRAALVATGLLSSLAVEPVPSDERAPDGMAYADLAVTQVAGPDRTIAASGGYSTGQGLRVEGSWTHRNFFPPEGALSWTGVAGTQEQALGVAFRRSNAGKRDRVVELDLSVLHSNYAAYEAYTGRLSGRISRSSTQIWQKRLTYGYGFELIGTNEEDYDYLKGGRDRQTYALFALPIQAGFDISNSLLNPTKGYRLNIKLSPEVSLGSGKQIYGRALIEGTAYYPIGDSIVLAGRARVASIAGIDRSKLIPSRRYYGGGGGSVRGFGFQQLGPRDPDNNPIGGRSTNEAAVEARYRFGNYGVAGFVDAGQVYESSLPRFNDWRFGAGIGGRFYTNFGPLRLDIATPINRQPGESRISVYVSIGQAF